MIFDVDQCAGVPVADMSVLVGLPLTTSTTFQRSCMYTPADATKFTVLLTMMPTSAPFVDSELAANTFASVPVGSWTGHYTNTDVYSELIVSDAGRTVVVAGYNSTSDARQPVLTTAAAQALTWLATQEPLATSSASPSASPSSPDASAPASSVPASASATSAVSSPPSSPPASADPTPDGTSGTGDNTIALAAIGGMVVIAGAGVGAAKLGLLAKVAGLLNR